MCFLSIRSLTFCFLLFLLATQSSSHNFIRGNHFERLAHYNTQTNPGAETAPLQNEVSILHYIFRCILFSKRVLYIFPSLKSVRSLSGSIRTLHRMLITRLQELKCLTVTITSSGSNSPSRAPSSPPTLAPTPKPGISITITIGGN